MSTIKELENQKQELRALIDRRDAMIRLTASSDFKKLILQEFCVDESARMASCCGDVNISESIRKVCFTAAQAGGCLERYIQVVMAMGNSAEESLKELEEEIVDLENGD